MIWFGKNNSTQYSWSTWQQHIVLIVAPCFLWFWILWVDQHDLVTLCCSGLTCFSSVRAFIVVSHFHLPIIMVVPDSIKDKVGPLPDISSMNKGKYLCWSINWMVSTLFFGFQMIWQLCAWNCMNNPVLCSKKSLWWRLRWRREKLRFTILRLNAVILMEHSRFQNWRKSTSSRWIQRKTK